MVWENPPEAPEPAGNSTFLPEVSCGLSRTLQAPVWFLFTAVGELQALLNKSQRTTCCTTTVHLHTQHTHMRTHVVIFISDAEIYL